MPVIRTWLCLSLAMLACGGDARVVPARDAAMRVDTSNDSDTGVADSGTPDPELPTTAWRSIADATWSEWYRYLPSKGRDVDPQGVFKVEAGVLHILGIEPPADDQEFGYIATRTEHSNYRLRLEQRWGTRKFAPRAELVRDSGLLYHLRGDDLIWPQCVEYQIQENDVGDLFLLGDVGVTTAVDPLDGNTFLEGGVSRVLRGGAVRKGSTHESLTDWNKLELIASEREFVHIVNGFVNHRGWALEYLNASEWQALDRGRIALQAEGAEVFYRGVQLRPLVFAPPPAGSVVLFDGTNLDAWQAQGGSGWRIVDGVLEAAAGSGDLVSRETFGDVRLHAEFRVPATLVNAAEQDRGNSGVYVQGRYELQILDSFGRELADRNDAAAIYGVRDADSNEALPPETWQSYDIVFRAARFDGDAKRQPARLTVVWNGTTVHRAVELPGSTGGGDAEAPSPGPLRLQDHGHAVRYRNIWLQRL